MHNEAVTLAKSQGSPQNKRLAGVELPPAIFCNARLGAAKMEKSNISQSDLLDVLTLERDNAIEAFRVACKKLHETDEDPNDEFNTTLDALAVAQLALKAEWVRQLRQLARMSPPTEARH